MVSPVLCAGNIGVTDLSCDLGQAPSRLWSPWSSSPRETSFKGHSQPLAGPGNPYCQVAFQKFEANLQCSLQS